ncbi:MAG: N-acetyl-gamma-glutamyl-phosphate reductase [Bacillota bacterium]|nr:N-acetyl-gamma-glutamyl-phosphate reductase [Bacillota bacterium]
MVKASILGATGYAGMELTRLITSHPQAEIAHLVSQSFAGKPYSAIYQSFASSGMMLEEMDISKISGDSDIIFASLPHGTSAETVKALYDRGCRVIDMSADYRYNDPAVYEKWYGAPHAFPELLKSSVYGLTEFYRKKIRGARLVGNPGCYTTCAILSLAPLMKSSVIDHHGIIIDAKSGATGAGRSPNEALHFCEVDENIKAYNVAKHRHTSEIEQELSLLHGGEIVVSFTPHLLPVKRGILATIYCPLADTASHKDILSLYRGFYKDEPFITLHEEGSLPEVKFVVGSNCIHIGFVVDKRTKRLIIVSALDNLVKGAAGQAVQNMNVMFGITESTGLSRTGWYL